MQRFNEVLDIVQTEYGLPHEFVEDIAEEIREGLEEAREELTDDLGLCSFAAVAARLEAILDEAHKRRHVSKERERALQLELQELLDNYESDDRTYAAEQREEELYQDDYWLNCAAEHLIERAVDQAQDDWLLDLDACDAFDLCRGQVCYVDADGKLQALQYHGQNVVREGPDLCLESTRAGLLLVEGARIHEVPNG